MTLEEYMSLAPESAHDYLSYIFACDRLSFVYESKNALGHWVPLTL